MVKVVSREFEKVLTEQYHCQGLAMAIRSCEYELATLWRIQGQHTHHRPCSRSVSTKQLLGESPGKPITQSSKGSLQNLGRGQQSNDIIMRRYGYCA